MKINFIFYVMVVLICFHTVTAQTGMPYLNASPGNNQSSVRGPDSSIYSFAGSKILKVDKSQTIKWSRDYAGVNFSTLLLSKTGGLFFLAGEKVGKLDANTGNLIWTQSYPVYQYNLGQQQYQSSPFFIQMLLDRNNQLAISGIKGAPLGGNGYGADAFFLKLDTNGTVLDQKVLLHSLPSLAFVNAFNIIQDSAGYYSFLVSLYRSPAPTRTYLLTYNSVTNHLNDTMKLVSSHNPSTTIRFYKSGLNATDFFIGATTSGLVRFLKYNSTRQKGDYTIVSSAQNSQDFFRAMGEDEKGDVSLTLYRGVVPIVVNLDSNFNKLSAFQFTNASQNFTNIWTGVWPFYNQSVFVLEGLTNNIRLFKGLAPPPCITSFSLGTSQVCNSALCAYPSVGFTNVFSFMTHTVAVTASLSSQPVSYTLSPFAPVLDFNYCPPPLSVEEQTKGEDTFRMTVFPQPTYGSVVLTTNKQTESEVIILNGLGSVVKKYHFSGPSLQIDLSDLPAGLYYAECRGMEGTNVAKIIKTN